MSHIVRVNFEQIAIECVAVCEQIEQRIESLNKQLSHLERLASNVSNDETQRYIASVRSQIESWRVQVERMRDKSDGLADLKSWEGDSDSSTYRNRYKLKDQVYNLKREVQHAVAQQKPAIQAFINQIHEEEISHINKEIAERNASLQNTTDDTEVLLNTIQDAQLRHFTYLAHLRRPQLTGDTLLAEGRKMQEETLEIARKQELNDERRRISQELRDAKVSDEEIEKVINVEGDGHSDKLEALYEQASNAIVGEAIRKKTLIMIKKAICERGFIVDPRNIRKDGNVVTLIAQKAGGEVAKFTVDLGGKFIYDFQGYEGQACQKDIEPFIKDLESVYGIQILKREEIWRNPDKILNQQKQIINSNHKNK